MIPSVAPELETVACNLCGGTDARPFAKRQGMQVVQCGGCGLVYVNPRLSPKSLHTHYNSGCSSRLDYYVDSEGADRRSFAEILDVVEQLHPRRGDLLDVGPNVGTCLAVARERGWRVTGIEINAEAAEYCRTRRKLNVVAGTLDAHPFSPASFDVVLMGDVIEHLPDPVGTLRIVQRLLRPGGLLAISTPDISSRAARLLQIKPEEHIYYFTPQTMDAALRHAGLETATVRSLDRYRNITAMSNSTTLGRLRGPLAPVFRVARRVMGDWVLRLPLRENLLAVARKPAHEQPVAVGYRKAG